MTPDPVSALMALAREAALPYAAMCEAPPGFRKQYAETYAADEAALRAAIEEAVRPDPMDWQIPCDIAIGDGVFRKGVRISTLVGYLRDDYPRDAAPPADAALQRGE